MPDNLILADSVVDARLNRARKLLSPQPQRTPSLKYALLSSFAFAVTALMLAVAIILGPGWEQTPASEPLVAGATAEMDATPKAMVVQVPAGGFELSATPIPMDGVNEAVPLSEDELAAGEARK